MMNDIWNSNGITPFLWVFSFYAFRCVILLKLPRNIRHCIRYLMLILQMTRSKRPEAILAICVEFGKDWTLLELCLNSSCPLSKFCKLFAMKMEELMFISLFVNVSQKIMFHRQMKKRPSDGLFHHFYRKIAFVVTIRSLDHLFPVLHLQKNLYE